MKISECFSLVLMVCCIISLTGCYDNWDYYEDTLCYVTNSFCNVCYISEFNWDGNEDNMTIDIPDRIKGYKVKYLGGYLGRGVPDPFRIQFPYEAEIYSDWELSEQDIAKVKVLHFVLNIGKNITEMRRINMQDYYRIDKSGELYRIELTVYCSPENKHFYSVDGKLYNRSDDSLVEDFFYYEDNNNSVKGLSFLQS